MAISVSCPCGKTLTVKDELAGKRGKCPQCGAPLTIPVPANPVPTMPVPATATQRPAASVPAVAVMPAATLQPAVGQLVGPPPALASPPFYPAYQPAYAAVPPAPVVMAVPVAQAPTAVWAYPVNYAPAAPVTPEVVGFSPAGGTALPAASASGAKPPILVPAAPVEPQASLFAPDMTAPQISTQAPIEREGVVLCPHCNGHLQSTTSAGNLLTQMSLGLVLGFYFRPTTPYRCRRCGPIAATALRGASLRAAQKSGRTFSVILLSVIGIMVLLSVLVIIMPPFDSDSGSEQLYQQQRLNELNRLAEQQRRQNEQRSKQEAERQKQERERKQREDAQRQRK